MKTSLSGANAGRMRCAVALTLGALAVALPAQGAPRAESRVMTIRLVSITTEFKVLVDMAPKQQYGKGDVIWAKSTLRNEVAQFGKAKGAIVGHDVSTYTVVSETKGDVKVTATLLGGTLRAAGRSGEEKVERIAVRGGTGVFAGARGVMETSEIAGQTSVRYARNVYRLQLP